MFLGIAGGLAAAGVPVGVILAGIAAIFVIGLLVNRMNAPSNCRICGEVAVAHVNMLCASCRTHLDETVREKLKEARERYDTDPTYRQRQDSAWRRRFGAGAGTPYEEEE